jgi:hypothetical protein
VLHRPVSWHLVFGNLDFDSICHGYNFVMTDTVTLLFRPVGQKEFDLIAQSGFRSFPPRLTGQPIFCPVLNEEYATFIAREWNTVDEA